MTSSTLSVVMPFWFVTSHEAIYRRTALPAYHSHICVWGAQQNRLQQGSVRDGAGYSLAEDLAAYENLVLMSSRKAAQDSFSMFIFAALDDFA
jgi:hypothetical protein